MKRAAAVVVALVLAACAGGSAAGPGDSGDADPIDAVDATETFEVLTFDGGRCSAGDSASMSRYWNEAALEAIRLDFPAPTVHARNLYHLSATLWDVWRAFEPAESAGSALFVDARRDASDVGAARDEALAFAAHRVLSERYLLSLARPETRLALNNALSSACGVPASYAEDEPTSAAAFGRSVADDVLAATVDDGSLELAAYADTSYEPVNPPLEVAEPGTELVDPDRWQPLLLDSNVSQNGVPLPPGEQVFIGSNWGGVTPFAIEVTDQPPLDVGPPPRISDPDTAQQYRDEAVDVIRASADLEVGVATLDIGPGSSDVALLAYEESGGHPTNPSTGEPYEPNEIDSADYLRAIAEYWADGPTSETPPGHWNSLADQASDALFAEGVPSIPGSDRGAVDPASTDTGAGTDTEADAVRLEWDVKLGVALNGALHDAAIAAWGTKAFHDSVRPISMIRWMAEQDGETSLPLSEGLVEVVTEETAAAGGRHAGLTVGEVAIRAWAGSPDDAENDVAGVEWIPAVSWVPYQRSTFVTPAFASYVSGHSVFSRAAAEVLVEFTGSEFFPGGVLRHEIAEGSFLHEDGPTEDITLEWATYRDAADEAGRSRIWGGIHIPSDDENGRELGREVGITAWDRAQELFSSDSS